jgi:hypothetical protein
MMLSPVRMPCFHAGPSSSTPMTAPGSPPTLARKRPVASPMPGVTVALNVAPPSCRTSNRRGCPGFASSALRMSSVFRIARPSTVRMLSPGRMPCVQAGLPRYTPATLPASELTCARLTPVMTRAATRKLTAGPPSRISRRW